MNEDNDTDTSYGSEYADEEEEVFYQLGAGRVDRILKWLQSGQVSIDMCCEFGETLLISACRCGHARFLIYASQGICDGCRKVATYLITHGCNVNYIADYDGCTALDLIVNDAEMKELLRAHGAKYSDEICEE